MHTQAWSEEKKLLSLTHTHTSGTLETESTGAIRTARIGCVREEDECILQDEGDAGVVVALVVHQLHDGVSIVRRRMCGGASGLGESDGNLAGSMCPIRTHLWMPIQPAAISAPKAIVNEAKNQILGGKR